MEPANLMTPCIYARGTAEYGAIDAVNQSTLKKILRSPRSYQHALARGWKETPSQAAGTAAHTAILEPVQFLCDYTLWDGGAKRGKAWEAFKADHPGKRFLKPEEFDAALAKRDAVRQHPVAGPLLKDVEAEVTFVWDDPETGIRLKARADALSRDRSHIVDVKTSRNVEPMWFGRDAYSYGYAVQAAFYSDGLTAITGKPAQFSIIAVETAEPHEVVVYDVPEEVIELGRADYRDALTKLAECRASKKWPGIAEHGPVPLQLPPWAFGDDGDDLGDLGLEF